MNDPKKPGDAALTHLDDEGSAAMVDVTDKASTSRRAVARGVLRCSTRRLQAPRRGRPTPRATWNRSHGSPVSWPASAPANSSRSATFFRARASAWTSSPTRRSRGLRVTATAKIARADAEWRWRRSPRWRWRCLTAYDMLKAADRGMTIESVRLVEKSGGRSGAWRESER